MFAVGGCRAAGLSKLKPGSNRSDSKPQKDILAYFRNAFAFQKRSVFVAVCSLACTSDVSEAIIRGHGPWSEP